jgi:hypothetical protein
MTNGTRSVDMTSLIKSAAVLNTAITVLILLAKQQVSNRNMAAIAQVKIVKPSKISLLAFKSSIKLGYSH